MRILFFIFILSLYLQADITQKIANMIIIGIDGTTVADNSSLTSFIKKNGLGGIILFSKNLQTKKQVKKLTSDFQNLCKSKLFIALDQEGGFVDRLSAINGINSFPSAKNISLLSDEESKKVYTNMARIFHNLGFNLNFAPCVDLAINPQNRVIAHFQRSYGKDPDKVVQKASIFIDAFKKNSSICVIKHFPGHGSSNSDSHLGFTDVTKTWQEVELKPFFKLIQMQKVQMLMSAHIFNKKLDPKYPATLSKKILTRLLRKSMGYDGVIISDDMQMGAISKNFRLKNSISLAINSGVDILLFGNQIGKPIKVQKIVSIIKDLLKEGRVTLSQIDEANQRINRLKSSYDMNQQFLF